MKNVLKIIGCLIILLFAFSCNKIITEKIYKNCTITIKDNSLCSDGTITNIVVIITDNNSRKEVSRNSFIIVKTSKDETLHIINK